MAIFLSAKVKSLLIGESADTSIIEHMREAMKADVRILEIINYKAIQQGPGEVLICVKIKCVTTYSCNILQN